MAATALVALDSTVLATVVPTIVRELGGFSQFPWLFSIYLLTSAVTTPLYGRLADTFGRRPVLFWGIALFLAGSVLCAAAPSMPVLIAGRAVQGLGAGAIQPVSITVVGDLYSVAERARVQGYLASVWGMSAVVGPAVGGILSQYASWRWIFISTSRSAPWPSGCSPAASPRASSGGPMRWTTPAPPCSSPGGRW